jgi:hypothetical protein
MLTTTSTIALLQPTTSPFDCGWYNIEKFLRIYTEVKMGTLSQPPLRTVVYYDHIGEQYIIEDVYSPCCPVYNYAHKSLTIRKYYEAYFDGWPYTLSYQLVNACMSMADGGPLPEEVDELLNIPLEEFFYSHPGASVSLIIHVTENEAPAVVAAVAPADEDLPTEELQTPPASLPLQLPSPLPLQPQLTEADIDPIELPEEHLLIA